MMPIEGKRGLAAWVIASVCLVVTLGDLGAATPGPTDWTDWERHRTKVAHPTGLIKAVDLERAARNIERYSWARDCAKGVRRSADTIIEKISPGYLSQMIEWTTPGCAGPCPACRAKGLPWHPNGQWSWSAARPDQLKCKVCATVFPNDQFPEDVVVESRWGRGQRLTFMGGETFKCFGYAHARPSISGVMRSHKINVITNEMGTLALAYALTRDARYARGAKAILLRFAEVFPEYLVRAGYGYGEYAGMDPHVAAERISDLPEDELVYPPNKPDRKIYTGYWSASRIGTSGMDGAWVVPVATAYDLTCEAQDGGKPVYSEDERRGIERDVLLEGTYLAACDPAINNKSVANRTGAAVVGMVVGHPGLVRFGLEGFRRTVEEWFLPDGGTSESAAYAMMTMAGVRPSALAFRHYSDPPGYVPQQGARLDDFDACRDTRFGDCWQGLVWSLQGDLRFPPSADSYRNTQIGVPYAEFLAVAYPKDENVALLKAIADTPSSGAARDALLYREPGFEQRVVPPLSLPDVVFPFLSQGYLRTGAAGRGSLLLLNASDWGGHHHRDSLDLYYWKDGKELLSDLGYLWDHPDKSKTSRTFAHNLVAVDGREQATKGRGGRFHLFSVSPSIKVMEASSDAYDGGRVYRRTCAVVDHGAAGSYVLDLFRVSGKGRRDYVFHGPNKNWKTEGLDLATVSGRVNLGTSKEGMEMDNVRVGTGADPWRVIWSFDDGYLFEAFAPGCAGEVVRMGDGWGQRDHSNTDAGAVLPYIVRSTDGTDPVTTFVSVFAGYPAGRRLVENVSIAPVEAPSSHAISAIIVKTAIGSDIFVSTLGQGTTTLSVAPVKVITDGFFSAVLTDRGETVAKLLVGGTRLAASGTEMQAAEGSYHGNIQGIGSVDGTSYFDIEPGSFGGGDLVGQTFFAQEGTSSRGYPIQAVTCAADGRTARVFVKRDHRGFEARPAERWEIPVATHWEKKR